MCLKEINFKQVSIQETSWYQNFEKIIFTSGTLQLNIDSDYFEEQLDLPTPEKFILREKYSYQDNAELLVIKDYENQDFGNEKIMLILLPSQLLRCIKLNKVQC